MDMIPASSCAHARELQNPEGAFHAWPVPVRCFMERSNKTKQNYHLKGKTGVSAVSKVQKFGKNEKCF
jgi:hypothetical protein